MKKQYHVCIDVKENDPVDIRCGGPRMLGFDYVIGEGTFPGKTTKEIETSIRKFLEENKLEYRYVTVREKLPYKVWSKNAIKKNMKETEL